MYKTVKAQIGATAAKLSNSMCWVSEKLMLLDPSVSTQGGQAGFSLK
jgi:hypothetical protein